MSDLLRVSAVLAGAWVLAPLVIAETGSSFLAVLVALGWALACAEVGR